MTHLAGNGKPGFSDGRGLSAAFDFPYGICVGPDGTLYVCDSANHRIRTVSQAGDVKTLAGTGTAGTRPDRPGW